MAVDIGRRAYRTKARFFSNSTDEDEIHWFPAREDAPCLPFPSAINNLDWATEPEIERTVGEVFGAARTYSSRAALPFKARGNYCGSPSDFRSGADFDPEREPIQYDQWDLPLCCGAPQKGLVAVAADPNRPPPGPLVGMVSIDVNPL